MPAGGGDLRGDIKVGDIVAGAAAPGAKIRRPVDSDEGATGRSLHLLLTADAGPLDWTRFTSPVWEPLNCGDHARDQRFESATGYDLLILPHPKG